MKWYVFVLIGVALAAFGIYIRKNEFDSAANARAAKAEKAEQSKQETV
jgi:hypothetical protein